MHLALFIAGLAGLGLWAWGTRHGDNFDYYLGAGAILMLVSLFGSAFA